MLVNRLKRDIHVIYKYMIYNIFNIYDMQVEIIIIKRLLSTLSGLYTIYF